VNTKVLGIINTYAISRREELPPMSIPRYGTTAVMANRVIYIPGNGATIGYKRPAELNKAYPPSRY
jgi:hypothetical protein